MIMELAQSRRATLEARRDADRAMQSAQEEAQQEWANRVQASQREAQLARQNLKVMALDTQKRALQALSEVGHSCSPGTQQLDLRDHANTSRFVRCVVDHLGLTGGQSALDERVVDPADNVSDIEHAAVPSATLSSEWRMPSHASGAADVHVRTACTAAINTTVSRCTDATAAQSGCASHTQVPWVASKVVNARPVSIDSLSCQ